MDPNKRAYRIRIDKGEGRARLICVSYPLDAAMTQFGLDFWELVWTKTGLPEHVIPTGRVASFAEELRALHRASKALPSGEDEPQFIAQTLRAVYGEASLWMSPINEELESEW